MSVDYYEEARGKSNSELWDALRERAKADPGLAALVVLWGRYRSYDRDNLSEIVHALNTAGDTLGSIVKYLDAAGEIIEIVALLGDAGDTLRSMAIDPKEVDANPWPAGDDPGVIDDDV